MAAPYNPPKKNKDCIFRLGLEDTAANGRLKVTPTIAAGDFQVDKDGGGFANLATLPSVSPAGSEAVLITLSATEMNADIVTLRCKDQTNPAEWADDMICFLTTA